MFPGRGRPITAGGSGVFSLPVPVLGSGVHTDFPHPQPLQLHQVSPHRASVAASVDAFGMNNGRKCVYGSPGYLYSVPLQ